MAPLTLLGQTTQQPQYPARAVSQACAHAWGLNVIGPAVYDACGSADGAFGVGNGGTTGNAWVLGSQGYFIKFDTTGTGTAASSVVPVGNSSGSGAPRTGVFSIQARVRFASLTGVQTIYGAPFKGIQFRINSSGQVQLASSGFLLLGSSIGSVAAGIDCDIGVSFNGVSVDFYINGVYSGSSSASTTFDLAQQCFLGAKESTGTAEALGSGSRIYSLVIWDKLRSAGEFSKTAENIWQIFSAQARIIFRPSATVQFIRPASYISAGAWTPSTGASLFDTINETPADDATYNTTPSASNFEVKLGAGSAPGVTTGHIARYRAQGTGSLTVRLMQGATVIATNTPSITAAYQTFTFTLSGAEAAAITDYTDLRLRFTST